MEYKPIIEKSAEGQECNNCPFEHVQDTYSCNKLFKQEFGVDCYDHTVRFIAQVESTIKL